MWQVIGHIGWTLKGSDVKCPFCQQTWTVTHQARPLSPHRTGQIKRTGRRGHVGGTLFAAERHSLSVEIKKSPVAIEGKNPRHPRLPARRKPIRLPITQWHGVTPLSGHSNTYYSSSSTKKEGQPKRKLDLGVWTRFTTTTTLGPKFGNGPTELTEPLNKIPRLHVCKDKGSKVAVKTVCILSWNFG